MRNVYAGAGGKKNMPYSSALNLPVWRDVDVLVVGATSGCVSAALELRRRNRTALAVCELSYFGEETAGTFNLWPSGLDRSDPLVQAMFDGSESPDPALPCHVKRALESALVRASVPFLYMSRPVALLRGEDGSLAGAIIAARTSLFAVRCSAVVDATRYGAVARMGGAALAKRPGLSRPPSWTVISEGVPAGWEGRAKELRPPFRTAPDVGAAAHGAYRLRLDRDAAGADRLAFEHISRASLTAPNVLAAADIIADTPGESWAAPEPHADSPGELRDNALEAAPGIFLLNGLLPLTRQGVEALERADVQAALGRRVGALAAARPRRKQAPAQGCVSACAGAGGDFRFAPAFLRQSKGMLVIPSLAFPVLGRCDVAVAGGGTGGAPAGISAARAGARTVVLEPQHGLGGVGTVGLISAYWFGNRTGFTAELDAEVGKLDAEFGGGKSGQWRPGIKSAVYHRMLRDAGGAAWLGSFAFGVRMDGARVDGVLVSTPFGCGLLEALCVVDATGNADIAAAAGAPCRVIGAEHLAVQGAGLSPITQPGTRYSNSDHAFVDETDPEGITAAFVNARAKFTGSFDTSPLVGSRERRQIFGEHEISPLDILAGRTFHDTVLAARSNFDSHGFIVHPVLMVAEPDLDSTLEANIPFRCMLPLGIEGVLVIGLGMSAHRDALPVLRMQADVQNQGFAAGLAAAWSAAGRRRLRDLDIRALQNRLAGAGILGTGAMADSPPFSDGAIADAARGNLRAPLNAAILFAHAGKSRPLLRRRLEKDTDAGVRIDAALILGLMGFPEGAQVLSEAVRSHSWDGGWNFTGMGQFGPGMSRMDAMILALARTRAPAAAGVIEAKIRELGDNPPFSHCRVAAIAAALLRNESLTRALAGLLRRPGMRGHALCDLRAMTEKADPDMNETGARNASLREIYLARGLFLAGDVNGLGRETLEAYANDLRGHYARHARAVMEPARVNDSLINMA